MKNMKILMVCTGNICRSPMAEGIARALLKAARRDDVSVDSAATHAYHTGDAPDPRARRVMRAHNMPIDDLRARPFIPEDFYAFDQILVADRGHHRHLTALAPDEAARAKSASCSTPCRKRRERNYPIRITVKRRILSAPSPCWTPPCAPDLPKRLRTDSPALNPTF